MRPLDALRVAAVADAAGPGDADEIGGRAYGGDRVACVTTDHAPLREVLAVLAPLEAELGGILKSRLASQEGAANERWPNQPSRLPDRAEAETPVAPTAVPAEPTPPSTAAPTARKPGSGLRTRAREAIARALVPARQPPHAKHAGRRRCAVRRLRCLRRLMSRSQPRKPRNR